MEHVLLCGFAFLAGFIDAVVGGGGLIQLPALMLILPDRAATDVASLFGTNKLSSIFGTTSAAIQYSRRVAINWRSILPAAVSAFVFSYLGARAVAGINPSVLQPVILVLLVAVAAYTAWNKKLGDLHAPAFTAHTERTLGVLVGLAIGFYDGFFGPGTGSFLIFAFIGLFGFDFLSASASSKVINVATNLSAAIYFAATDHILYGFALPMAACNIAGAVLGARLAILRGNRFVRVLFLVVVGALIARLAWQMFKR
jgi:hypothetical protein